MPRRLRKLRIEEISPVDEGANQGADVVLLKSTEQPETSEVDVNLTEIAKALGLAETATAEEVVAAIETFKSANKVAVDEANTKAETASTKLAEVEKALTAATKPVEPDVTETLPEDVRKQLTELAEIKKSLAAAEVEAARLVEVNKAKDAYKNLIDQDTIGSALFTLRKSDKGAADKLEAVLKAADARAALAPVTEVVGTSETDNATGEDRLEVLAKKLHAESAGKLSFEQAYTKALKENPHLLTGQPVAEDK